MKKYTVLLLYPDYIAESYGEDTYLGWVVADNPEKALKTARREVMNRQPCGLRRTAADFFCLAVFEGHLSDVNPAFPRLFSSI